jgi:type IV pilus biogenesis protein CpaD/CtpE
MIDKIKNKKIRIYLIVLIILLAITSCNLKTSITGFAVLDENATNKTITTETTTTDLTTNQTTSTSGLSAITGAVIRVFANSKAIRELIIGVVVIVLIASGFIGYKFMYKRKFKRK